MTSNILLVPSSALLRAMRLGFAGCGNVPAPRLSSQPRTLEPPPTRALAFDIAAAPAAIVRRLVHLLEHP